MIISMVAIFLGFNKENTGKGAPAHFLIIAPPAVASIGIAGFTGGYNAIP
jgi:hypothetical protein